MKQEEQYLRYTRNGQCQSYYADDTALLGRGADKESYSSKSYKPLL